MSLLTFTDVRKAYRAQEVLRGATFFVAPGRKTALVGPNGAGKTTLLRMAAGQETPDSGRVNLAPATRVGMLEQEPLSGGEDDGPEPPLTVLEAAQRPSREHQRAWTELLRLEASLESADGDGFLAAYDAAQHRYQDLGGYDCENRAREVLAGLGLPTSAWERPVSVLSGGERTRLGLARLLVLQPDLLLLDEPTNHIDWEAAEWLQEYLARYPGAALLVSHDRYFIDHVVSEVVSLEEGKTRTYAGNYSAFVRKRAAEEAQAAERAERLQQEIQRQEAIIQRLRSHRKFNSMHSREKALARLGTPDAPAKEARGVRAIVQPERTSGRVALTARSLSFAYGPRSLFGGVSFTLERGERLGIIGPNGVGKSTLLKVLAGELRAPGGEVSLGYQVEAAYFAQDLSSLDPEATVFETIFEAADLTLTETFQTLHRFLFMGDAVEKTIDKLSGGERTRLALARLLVRRPNLLLLDEPTNHLDIPSREAVEDALAEFPGALVVVSHDRYFLERVPTRLLELRPGIHRLFDGGYSRYRETLAPQTAPAAPPRRPQRPQPAPAPKPASPLKLLRDLERQIEASEQRIGVLTEQLADPETYRSAAAAELSAEYQALTAQLEGLYERWSELAEQVPAGKK